MNPDEFEIKDTTRSNNFAEFEYEAEFIQSLLSTGKKT